MDGRFRARTPRCRAPHRSQVPVGGIKRGGQVGEGDRSERWMIVKECSLRNSARLGASRADSGRDPGVTSPGASRMGRNAGEGV